MFTLPILNMMGSGRFFITVVLLLNGWGIFFHPLTAVEHPKTLVGRIEMVLKYGHSQQIRDAVARIPELKEEEQLKLIPILSDLLSLEDYLVQKKIIELVGKVNWKDLDNKLVPFLDSNYDVVFYSAVNSIEKKNITDAFTVIEKKLKEADYSKEDNKLLTLIRLAGTLKDKNLIEFFNQQMRNEDNHPVLRREMLRYMGDVSADNPDIIAYLTERALDKNEKITLRAHAVYALSKTDSSTATLHFKTILAEIDSIEDIRKKRKYASLRTQLISALAKNGDENIIKILVKMAKDDDAQVRLKAVRELGKLENNQVIELIRYKAYYDPDLSVQSEARKILKTLGALEEEQTDAPKTSEKKEVSN